MNVINSLVLELNLDPSGFTRGQRSAIRSLREFENEAGRAAKNAERDARRADQSMSLIKQGLVGIVGGYGVAQIANFTRTLTLADAAIGRTARTANTSARDLGTWQNMIKLVGGTAEEATQSIVSLSDEIEDLKAGKGSAGFLRLFNQFGIRHSDPTTGATRPTTEILTELQGHIARQMQQTGQTPSSMASWLRTMPGMSPTMAHLLTQSTGEFNRIRGIASANAPSARDVEAAQKATEAMEKVAQSATGLWRAFITLTQPITGLIDSITKILSTDPTGGKGIINYFKNPLGGKGWRGLLPEIIPGGMLDRTMDYWAGRRKTIGRTTAEMNGSASAAAAGSSLRVKPGAGMEGTHPGTQMLADELQRTIPGLNRFTSGNDAYHRNSWPRSMHAQGQALDFTIKDKSEAVATAQAVREKLKAMGVNATVIDEYNNPSRGSTGGHIHVQFNSAADAQKYAAARAPRTGAGAAASAASAGAAGGGSNTTSNEVNIGTMIVNDSSGNPDNVANGIKKSIENVGLGVSINTGLN